MPVKLPAHSCLFYWDIKPLTEHEGIGTDFYYHPDKRKQLKKILQEYEKLDFFEDSAEVGPMSWPNVFLPNVTQVIAIPKNKEKLGALMLRVHSVVRDMFVRADIYRRMGETFEEYGLSIEDEELKIATQLASDIPYNASYERTSRFNAQMEVGRVLSGRKEVK